MLASEGLSSEGFGEVGSDSDCFLAVGDAFEVLSDVVIGSGSVGEIAVFLGVEFDGLGVGFDGFFVVFGCEGGVSIFFPVLS